MRTKIEPCRANPFLRWAGSKRQAAEFIETVWSNGSFLRYVEPFAGSAAIFFRIQPGAALLSDLNRELIDTYATVRDKPVLVSKVLASFPLGEAAYYEVRACDTHSMRDVDRAARFIYLNRFCFNGLYRTNRAGGFNVPYGRPKNSNLPDAKQLEDCSRALKRALVVGCDFRTTLDCVCAGDFVYLDPPYAVASRRVFRQYSSKEFSLVDFEELAVYLDRLHQAGATFVLSYADCRESRALRDRWTSRRRLIRRNVAGFAGARRNQFEIVLSNLESLEVAAHPVDYVERQ